MPDTPNAAAAAVPVAHRVKVVIEGEVDLYEYDDMDRGEITVEGLASWKRLCKSDIEDSLVGTLDTVQLVTFTPVDSRVTIDEAQ